MPERTRCIRCRRRSPIAVKAHRGYCSDACETDAMADAFDDEWDPPLHLGDPGYVIDLTD